ncbi:dystroglycan-like [Amphibalanus amphitrite]|uniref:dystroglycan-like n=1 Tax=Amphibalanus amphitrite TaxID=1232801 RepID=UPI001C8FDFFD|nr:dystroglycan-like [Amphibalanus amphitrite]
MSPPPRLLQLPLLILAVLAPSATAALTGADPSAGRVLSVPPISDQEHVRTDGTDDLGFSGSVRLDTDPLKRLWGVSDATARAGRLFVHAIDRDAFQGSVERFEVGGAKGTSPLPRWLTFDAARRTFSGVPLVSDLGPHIVSVRAIGPHGATATDRFMVDVVREPDADPANRLVALDGETGEVRCAGDTATTFLSVYFDVPPQSLDGAQRLALLRAVADRLQVDASSTDVAETTSLPLDGPSVLEAAAAAGGRHAGPLTSLSWRVGCSGRLRAEWRSTLQALRSDSHLGQLAAAAGRPASGWVLTARAPTGRHRREIDGSGAGYSDDDYSYDDYDYSYDAYIYEDDYPASRVVPSLATPSLGAPPSSPVYDPPRVWASVSLSGMSTPVPVPVRPTIYPGGLEPSGRVPDWDAPPPPHHTTHLESSMAVPDGRVEMTARLPDGAAVAPTAAWNDILTETATVAVPNFPPHVKRHMRKQLLVAGKEFRVRVPEETFEDLESGTTRQLRLSVRRADGQPLAADSWLQFDADTQEIYGLPHEEHVGEYQFELIAEDEGGLTTSELLSVSLRLSPRWRAINHRFYLTFELLRPADFNRTVDWELLLLRKLAGLFNQSSASSLLVYDIRQIDGSVRLGWVNDTISTHRCDKRALARVASLLLGKDGGPTAQLRNALQPQFQAQKIRLELLNVCHGAELESVPPPATEKPRENSEPQRLRQLDRIPASVGKLLKLQVPADTFFDEEDGYAREMELRLLTGDRQPVPPSSWLQFEPKNQEFIGLPLDEHVGRTHYHLECIDSGGLKTFDSIEVEVAPRQNNTDYTVEFGVTLQNDFASFSSDPLQKQRLIEKLAELLGDSSADSILVHSIQEGSVLFSWFNESLPREHCPDDEITALRSALLDDDRVQPAAVQALGPEFRLVNASVTPRGICLADETPTTEAAPTVAAGPRDEEAPESKGDEYLVTFIIPAVVIAAMLIIAGLIACVLYRARRRGKMTMTDNGTYVSRGIPVIFSDELEDRMEKNAKTPVILTNERPPEPPTYPSEDASPATPMLDARGEPAGSGSEDTPYVRPAPFASADDSARSGRTRPAANYRQPPPYVPP